MSSPKPNLKQIAKRYAGNLSYFKNAHYLRTLRKKAFLIPTVLGALLILVLALLAALQKYGKDQFILARIYNPGPISQAHADIAHDCAACHEAPNRLLQVSVEDSPVDASCMKCHTAHNFHVTQTPRGHSCSACHHEHLTAGPMKPVTDANCASCHNDAALMRAAAERAKTLPPEALDLTPRGDGHVHFQPGRPKDAGAVFASFEKGHPDWQIHREKLKDPNTLAFNHAVHLGGEGIPLVDGKKLDCASCHVPDASGAHMQPIVFEKHCQSCHSLQFDPRNPDLQLPHGDPPAVRAYLASVQTAYAAKGRAAGITDDRQLREYVATQMEALRRDVRSGENLERNIFFSDAQKSPVNRLGGEGRMPDEGRARFAGCAYCHQVSPGPGGVPQIAPTVTPDRWLGRAVFDHAKHTHMACTDCHKAEASRVTSDILMPERTSCLECHSTKGAIVADCQTCHTYHAHPTSPAAQAHFGAAATSLKDMMRGPDNLAQGQ